MNVRTGCLRLALTILASWPLAAFSAPKIDLVEFGRVVELPDQPSRMTTARDELVRGAEGWEAPRGDDGEYTIGVEWDQPRELAEVNIEFRHAIANREQIRVQYWQEHPAVATGGESHREKPVPGRWRTPNTEWWAGDRDVSFSFLPGDQEAEGSRADPKESTRRTRRLRFLIGKDELPPVRYLRAYGPQRALVETFDIKFSDGLKPPMAVILENGFILAGDRKTRMTTAVLREKHNPLQIVYAATGPDGAGERLNRTQVILSSADDPEKEVAFYPDEAAGKGQLRLDSGGVVIERRGGKLPETRKAAGTAPAVRPGTAK